MILNHELKALANVLCVIQLASWGQKSLKDPVFKLRSATRRAKSDVANKLVSMFLHELSRKISQNWPVKVDGEEYERLVRER